MPCERPRASSETWRSLQVVPCRCRSAARDAVHSLAQALWSGDGATVKLLRRHLADIDVHTHRDNGPPLRSARVWRTLPRGVSFARRVDCSSAQCVGHELGLSVDGHDERGQAVVHGELGHSRSMPALRCVVCHRLDEVRRTVRARVSRQCADDVAVLLAQR